MLHLPPTSRRQVDVDPAREELARVPGALAVPDEDDALGDDVSADGDAVASLLGPVLLLSAQHHVRDSPSVQPRLEKYPTGDGRRDRRHGEGDVRGHDGERVGEYRGPVDPGGDRREDGHVTVTEGESRRR